MSYGDPSRNDGYVAILTLLFGIAVAAAALFTSGAVHI